MLGNENQKLIRRTFFYNVIDQTALWLDVLSSPSAYPSGHLSDKEAWVERLESSSYTVYFKVGDYVFHQFESSQLSCDKSPENLFSLNTLNTTHRDQL